MTPNPGGEEIEARLEFETRAERGRRIARGSNEQTETARGGFVKCRTVKDGLLVSADSLSEISAQKGDTVSVHYLGRFSGGKVFDTSMKAEAVKAGLFSPARDYKPL